MTLAELITKARELHPSGSLSIGVEVWDHPGRQEIEWMIWDGKSIHKGSTAQNALNTMIEALTALPREPEPTLEQASAAVGELS